ncbi:helix-turn-helix transcriptional regulator [Actinophytocola xinjiangensis]|uniref:Helix-turn-helix transcriptional regulator n=1 Tax=Actinophytocola xinjiangensis TaxID=485602 RepID=A0A7Z0WLG5_9PSEU|nr:response regulator transcription factor [Actinophytocola xinjiangensis]OLF09763.1 helix-turn-helix transcriptional regulator [Actinophytocola xinjiangensis]
MEQHVRVAVHAGDDLSLTGLTSYLAHRPDITVVPACDRARADVVVMALPGLTADAVTCLREAADASPVPVVLILDHLGDADALTVAECRIVAVLARATVTGDRVLRSVLAAAAGGGLMPPNLVAELLEHVRRLRAELAAPLSESGRLTAREIDVLRLMADGLDTAEIASMLSYSERAIKNVFYGITGRLGLRNRPHAVAYALRRGMI